MSLKNSPKVGRDQSGERSRTIPPTARQVLDRVSPPQTVCTDCGAPNAKQKYPGMPVAMCPPRCPLCEEYSDIVNTSVEDAQYRIREASEAALMRVLKCSNKITLRKAAARQLTKLNSARLAQEKGAAK